MSVSGPPDVVLVSTILSLCVYSRFAYLFDTSDNVWILRLAKLKMA